MKKILPLALLFMITVTGCSVFETFSNITRLKFKLGNVYNISLNGVNLSNKSRFEDFSATEILAISGAAARGTMPISFTLNVRANNPNDGTGGYPRTNASLKSFPWRLLINEKETISGNISSPVSVPGTGEDTIIPLSIGMDLMKFFGDRGYREIINLALNIAGYQNTPTNLALYARPVVSSPLGDISYPGELKIVDVDYTR